MKRKELEKYLSENKKSREDNSFEFHSESSSEEELHFPTKDLPPVPISSELMELLKIAKQLKDDGSTQKHEIPKDCKRVGPLSVKENFKWKGFQFYIDSTERKLASKDKEYSIDLKVVSEIRRTKVWNAKNLTIQGLWPGFELITPKDSIVFHAESEEEIAGWMNDLKLLISSQTDV